MLASVTDLEEVPLEPLAARHGVAAERARELLALLDDARLLAPPPANRRGPDREPVPARLGDELQVHALLSEDADGAALLHARASRSVAVVGLGRTGAVVAGTLAAAGVGTLELSDPELVSPHEPGVGGISERDVGARREQAVARAVTDLAPGTRALVGELESPEVLVLVASYGVDPDVMAGFEARGLPVLPIVVREAGASVGPFVAPGSSPCWRCVDRHLADADPDWPLVLAQLCARARRRSAPQAAELAQLAGSLAASQVLAVLDGGVPATAGASLELALPQPMVQRREWSTHPACGCADHVPAWSPC